MISLPTIKIIIRMEMDNQQVSALKPVPTKDGYYVSPCGDIYSTRRGNQLRKLKPYTHFGRSQKQPYLRISFAGSHHLVHRIVLSAKIGRWLDTGEYVNHINGVAIDNRFENLEVVTHKQNMEHASINNLLCSGDDWYISRGMVPR